MPRLLKQSAIRAGAMVIVKLIGLTGRVLFTRMVGPEGIGLYQIAYSTFGFVLMLTGGLPTALALATARQPSHGYPVMKRVSAGLIGFGLCVSLMFFYCSEGISRLFDNPGLAPAFRGLAPALFAVPLLNLLRGYLQGLNRIAIIAASEIAEQGFRITFLLLLVWNMLPLGIDHAVGAGMIGTFIGAFLSFLMLAFYLSMVNPGILAGPANSGSRNISVIPLLHSSLAITATRILIPASEFIDAVLVPNRLTAAGYSHTESTSMYGIIYGMAVLVSYSPTLLTGAISHTLTARLASEWQQADRGSFHVITAKAFQASWIWGAASGLFLLIYARELSFYIFHTEAAVLPIRALAAIPLLVGFREITTNMLWSQDRKKLPFFGILGGIACSTIAQYVLVGIPGFGFYGAVISIVLLEAVSLFWNLYSLRISRETTKGKIAPVAADLLVLCAMLNGITWLVPGSAGKMGVWASVSSALIYFTLTGGYMYFRSFHAVKR